MALNLEAMLGEVRKEHVNQGRAFGSPDTLAQAEATLEGCALHGALLAEHGFGPEDVEDLTEARDLLIAAGVERETKRTGNKTTTKAFLAAMKKGKWERRRGRTVLSRSATKLRQNGTQAGLDAAKSVAALLERTARSGASAEKLATQLDQLGAELAKAPVAAVAATRGGPRAIEELAKAATELRRPGLKTATKGTVAETEYLDLLDGIIVSLVRDAREAARSAAGEHGRPALAKAFELTKLYRNAAAAAAPQAPEPAPTA
jgi:hypothetical protein